MPGGPGPDENLMDVSGEDEDLRAKDGKRCITKIDYLGTIMDWAPVVTDSVARLNFETAIEWGLLVLERGILVFDNPRAELCMRAWVGLYKNMESMEDLLNLAVDHAIPFYLYVRMSNIPLFRAVKISEVKRWTLPATLEPRYEDTRLVWSGPKNTRAWLFDLVGKMIQKPYAGAFLELGALLIG
ncbi:hypothetical protein DFH09DRAFT_1309393 [Mycena vulgaris]|nr:hypothetical protein DFH09DRAFT_1309393 [Mycena vulgaris]